MIRSEIGKHFFRLKEESIGDPIQYLGGKIKKVILDNGAEAWAFGSKHYVEEAVKNVVDYFENRNQKLVSKAPTTLTSGYRL